MTSNKELVRLLSEAIVEQASGNDLEAFYKVKEYMTKWSNNAIEQFHKYQKEAGDNVES